MLSAIDIASIGRAAHDRLRADELGPPGESLVHLTDEAPGIRRQRKGRGFAYLAPDGSSISDARERARIAAIAIPPAWTEVWISPDPNGHLQATGRDQKGRKQYRYHAHWSACRDEVKYGNLVRFATVLPELRGQVEADLRRRALSLPLVAASIVWLLDNTMIRVGNAAYARQNRSFGLTTLRERHVALEGTRIRFDFRGKSGKRWTLKLADRRIARVVRGLQDLPGQSLFQYLDEDGARRPVRSEDVNAYIRGIAGEEFTSKHFRTWGGTVRALSLFAETERPDTKTGQARAANAVIDAVASGLGNTRAVCRKCYIHPRVFSAWTDGALAGELAKLRPRPIERLDPEEALTLSWLRRYES